MHAAFDVYRDRYTPAGFADTVPDSMEERLRTMAVFVATDEGTVAGTISCAAHGSEGHLRGMAVRPEWQGGGIARALVEAAESELQTRGCKRVTLGTTEPLERAMHFYAKSGYRRTGRISDFFGMTLIEWAKSLNTT